MQYTIGTRLYSGPDKLDFSLPHCNFFTELQHVQCMSLTGEHALKVLQGQLSNDVFIQDKSLLQQHLLCNLKGELLTKIRLINLGQEVRMFLAKDLMTTVSSILEKPLALARVRLVPLDLKVYGIFNPPHQEDGFFRLDKTSYLSFSPFHGMQEGSPLEWHYQRLLAGDFEIYPETCRQFHPHDLQLEQGWINFNKGCYRGQEIIARMHYRGKRKYQLIQIEKCSNYPLHPGLELEEGTVVDFCPINLEQNLVLLRKKIG